MANSRLVQEDRSFLHKVRQFVFKQCILVNLISLNFSQITTNTGEFVKSPIFLGATRAWMMKFLSYDFLKIQEIDLFNAVEK